MGEEAKESPSSRSLLALPCWTEGSDAPPRWSPSRPNVSEEGPPLEDDEGVERRGSSKSMRFGASAALALLEDAVPRDAFVWKLR